MQRIRWLALVVALVPAALAGWGASLSAAPSGTVYLLKLNGVVGPATARYVARGLDAAQRAHAQALMIELDTPGGLMHSMDDIAKAELNSPVPTIVYVYPSGARAASAGVFVTYASNIAAMATTTHLGAAHPVGIGPMGGGGNSDKTEMT